MRNRKSLYTSIALLFAIPLTISSGYVLAQDTNLADDIENPDSLEKIVSPEKKNAQYGESNIVISGDGDKHNEIVTPDPLESSVSKKHDDKAHAKSIKLQPREVTEDDKAIESPDPLLRTTQPKKKASRSSSQRNSDLETDDPLLDNMN